MGISRYIYTVRYTLANRPKGLKMANSSIEFLSLLTTGLRHLMAGKSGMGT